MRLWSYQALAHGSDTVLFFQLRASRGASEKYHGAVINHASRSDTRVFQEVAALGAELPLLADVVGAKTRSKVALILDWNSWWAIEISDGPSRHVSYVQTAIAWYAALQRLDVDVDVVPVDADLSAYDVVLAPLLHMVPDELAGRLKGFVAGGGKFVTGVLSGRVDVDDNAFLMDVPGPLARVLGIRVDETDAQEPSVVNPVQLDGVTVEGSLVFDLVIPEYAEVVGTYTSDFYAGTAAVTRHRFGAGHSWYIGTMLDAAGLDSVLGTVIEEAGLTGSYARIDGVEATRRYKDGQRYLFLLNHGDREVRVAADMTGTDLLTGVRVEAGEKLVLPATGVVVLRSDDV
jgi:beta-galactosidase